MKAKKVTAIILAGAICAAAFTGCGINTGATAASMKNQTVTMGMANFTCRYQQANVEDYYKTSKKATCCGFYFLGCGPAFLIFSGICGYLVLKFASNIIASSLAISS